MTVIRVNELKKGYRTVQRREGIWGGVLDLVVPRRKVVEAVRGISFEIQSGELVGYIGPNGAGKSTSIKMLTGILAPSSGTASVLGFDPFKDRRVYTKEIGVVFGQRTQLWWDIAVKESFLLLRRIYGVNDYDFQERIEYICDVLDLRDLLHTPVRKLSLGQRVRCDLAASLLHGPKVLFLDEPTIGLDTVAKDAVRSFLRKINRELGTTVLLTTHDLREIEELCQRIIIIDKGIVIYDGGLEKIRRLPGLGKKIVVDMVHKSPDLSELEDLFGHTITFELQGERRITAMIPVEKMATTEVVRRLFSSYEIADLTISEPSIEEIIVKIYRDGLVKY